MRTIFFHIKSDNLGTFIFSYGKIMQIIQALVKKNEIPTSGNNPDISVEM